MGAKDRERQLMPKVEPWMRERGRSSERHVADCLVLMREMGFIRGFRKTKPESKQDHAGIDYFIFTDRERIPLQVKSSLAAINCLAAYSPPEKVWVVNGQRPSVMLLWDLVHIVRAAKRRVLVQRPSGDIKDLIYINTDGKEVIFDGTV